MSLVQNVLLNLCGYARILHLSPSIRTILSIPSFRSLENGFLFVTNNALFASFRVFKYKSKYKDAWSEIKTDLSLSPFPRIVIYFFSKLTSDISMPLNSDTLHPVHDNISISALSRIFPQANLICSISFSVYAIFFFFVVFIFFTLHRIARWKRMLVRIFYYSSLCSINYVLAYI